MRVIDFSDGFSSSAAPIASAITASALGSYANDAAFTTWLTGIGGTLAAGYAYFNSTDSTIHSYDGATWHSGSGVGTVTSVGASVPAALLLISGSPVTASGTLAITLATQTANTIFAGPTSGGAATPTFRAHVSSDVNGTTLSEPSDVINVGLAATIASSALTVAIKQKDASTNPTADNPAIYSLRSTTATTGSYSHQAISAAASVVIASGTTLGFTSSVNNYLYIYGASSGVILAAPSLWDEQTLQAYVQESAALTSISNASPGVCTLAGHGLNNGDAITLTTSGGLPTGLSTGTIYYVVSTAANTFSLAATPGGTAINTSSAGSGTHTYHVACNRLVCTAGTAAATGKAIRLLGRMQFNITAGTWAAPNEASAASAPQIRKAPTIQKFTSGSGTYVLPSGVLYIRVRMVGGGGGGAGSGSASNGNGGTGGNSTFGTALLVANGGGGGSNVSSGGANGGSGGSASLGTGPVGLALTGNAGGSVVNVNAAVGGSGAGSALGGGGAGGAGANTGSAGATNTGGGGGGGSGSASTYGGPGGGSGGHVDAIIASPSATYSYAVGAAGTAGTAGTGGVAGGAGGSGIILVEEYYQ